MKAFFLDDPRDREAFLAPTTKQILIPGTTETVDYDPVKRARRARHAGWARARQSPFGAYAFALNELDRGAGQSFAL